MVFSYRIKKGRAKDKITLDSSTLQFQNISNYKLPITMDPLNYGRLVDQIDNKF
jgi:hypothetical protein